MQKTTAVPRLGSEETGVPAEPTAETGVPRIALISAAIAAFRRDWRQAPTLPRDDGGCNPWKMFGRLDALRRR